MKLTNPTDDQLDAAFAEHVAGWKNCDDRSMLGDAPNMEFAYDEHVKITRFTRSADAVLSWLEKWPRNWTKTGRMCVGLETWSDEDGIGDVEAVAESFPRAAVIALLKAHGVEVEFTK